MRNEKTFPGPAIEALHKEVHELIRIARKALRSIELLEMAAAKEDLWTNANFDKHEDLRAIIDEYDGLDD